MQLDDLSYIGDTVQASVLQVADQFDVEFVTLHLFRAGADAQNNIYVRTNYPDAWVTHYLVNDYVRRDPVLQFAKKASGPFCWSQMDLEPEHQGVMEQAEKHGVRPTGFSVSHVDAIGWRSVLSFNAQEARGGETWEPFVKAHHDHLIALAAELHRMALAEIPKDSEDLPQLTPRELECLQWTAAGKAHTDIAIILNLSEHTVRSYLKDARTKLDSVTLAQAVSKASSLGLIEG